MTMKTQVFVAFIIAPLTKRHDYRLKGLKLMEAQNAESCVFIGRQNLRHPYHIYRNNNINECGLKSFIFIEGDVLWITGR